MKKNIIGIMLLTLSLTACKKDRPVIDRSIKESKLTVGDHQLTYYHSNTHANTLVVFESGLGDDASPWALQNIIAETLKSADVLLYDRAGYGNSTPGNAIRNLQRLSFELSDVINAVAGSRKVVLVGHSLGGLIIRDFAIHNSSKIAALLFVDPSHEQYNLANTSQSLEDSIYNGFQQYYGPGFGGTLEARQLIEDLQYTASLPALPNVPVTVLSSMKTDSAHSLQDRQNWFNAHEQLKTGISNFVHIGVPASGHYIQLEQPGLVIAELEKLLQRIH
jgi:pimeloyl-ACP methyl ester carboxylesterase